MKNNYLKIVFLLLPIMFLCQNPNSIDRLKIKRDIISVLNKQIKSWNEGNIEGYMAGYHRSDSLRFASEGNVYQGWIQTLQRYKERYPNKSSMGILNFSDMQVTILSGSAALVFGKWNLKRENDNPCGLFTLLFRKINKEWRIVHDHTSSEQN